MDWNLRQWTSQSFVMALFLCMLLAVSSTLCAQTVPHKLFNGKDLTGWEHVGPGSFVVSDGLLKTQGGMGLLWYPREKIGRAKIHIIFRLLSKESDSGLFIRIPEKPTEPWMPVNRGYEVEIGDWPEDYSCTGVLYTFTKALARPLKSLGEWNALDVILDGKHIVVYLNDVKVTDFHEGDPVPPKKEGSIDPERGPRPESGYIGLQNEPGGEVEFKEVSISPLK